MARIKVTFSFFNERPYGEFANAPGAGKTIKENLEYSGRLNDFLDKRGIPRNHFFIGSFLERAVKEAGKGGIREIFNGAGLSVPGNHTWSHGVLEPVKARPDKHPIQDHELKSELYDAHNLIEGVFGEGSCRTFASPLGYATGFDEGSRILELLGPENLDYKIAVTATRGPNESLFAPLYDKNGLRQPSFYRNGILEAPGHWWQDVALMHVHPREKPLEAPLSEEKIISSWREYLDQARCVSEEEGRTIYIQPAMHPYPYMGSRESGYDPDLEVFQGLVETVEGFAKYGAGFADLNQVYQECLSSR